MPGSNHRPLATAWARGLGPDADIELTADLEERLRGLPLRAGDLRTEIELDDDIFVHHVGELLRPNADPIGALEGLRVDELWLTCGCKVGSPAALRIFERTYVPEAKRVLRHKGSSTDEDEFLQRFRDRLLTSTGDKPPRIAAFSGRGELRNWVRVVAHRMILDDFRSRGQDLETPTDASSAIASSAPDPEMAALKSAYRDDFKAAFESAFASLSAGDRTLLRYRYVDGLEVQQIAVIDGRHRVSVSRALSRIRNTLLEQLRADLAERLRMGASEAESMVRFMRSQLDVSISRLLRAD